MKTYVAEEVLTDYTDGLVVVKAESLEKARELISEDRFFDETEEVRVSLRELKEDEVVYVWGGA